MVHERLGGDEYAALSLDSLNYGDLNRNRLAGNQSANADLLVSAANRLKASQAEAIVICANTPHMFVPDIERRVELPVIHIAEANKNAVVERGLHRVALIGTRFTTDLDFYDSRLRKAGIECITPGDTDKDMLDRTIFGELSRGEFTPAIRELYLQMIDRLVEDGAEGIILGCTEIPLLLEGCETPVPTFDTTRIHAAAAVDFMLGDG